MAGRGKRAGPDDGHDSGIGSHLTSAFRAPKRRRVRNSCVGELKSPLKEFGRKVSAPENGGKQPDHLINTANFLRARQAASGRADCENQNPSLQTRPSPRRPPKRKGGLEADKSEAITPGYFAKGPIMPGLPTLTARPKDCRSVYCVQCAPRDELIHSDFSNRLHEIVGGSHRLVFPGLQDLKSVSRSVRPDRNWVTASSTISPACRGQIVNFFVYCTRMLSSLSPFTLHLAVATLDRFASKVTRNGTREARQKLSQCINVAGAAALALASKIEDVWIIHSEDICTASKRTIVPKDLRVWEQRMLAVLNFQINVPTILEFLIRFFCEARSVRIHRSRQTATPRQCWCTVCDGCGQPLEDAQVSDAIMDIQRDTWYPGTKEAIGKTPIEACSIFVAEVFLSHHLSIEYSYHLTAAGVLKFTTMVLTGDEDVDDLLPQSCIECLDEEGDGVRRLLLAIGSVYAEHSRNASGSDKAYLDNLNKRLMKKDTNDPLMQEVLAASDLPDKCRKLTAYLIHERHQKGGSISATEARKVAEEFIYSRGQDDLDAIAARVSSGIKGEAKPPALARADVSCALPDLRYDLNVKHMDAYRLFDDQFRKWTQEHVMGTKLAERRSRSCCRQPQERRRRLSSLPAQPPALEELYATATPPAVGAKVKNDGLEAADQSTCSTLRPSPAVPLPLVSLIPLSQRLAASD